ncbi:DUF4229 domain-containing protein [Salinispora vitiensis]|uniref:DUF4229 domain-containing protein n=1 Tax=Salinispora vitiensis TaxID=999544 RepID=UPI000360C9FA|nr:DUF4229 domain-containing protein [Salinispora vitiensis]
MSAAVKYTLGRIGLFVAVLAALWLVELNLFVKLMVALIFSAALSFFLLRPWREEMAEEMAAATERRRAEKERLRSALAGEDEAGADSTEPGGEGDAGTGSAEPGGDAPKS